MPQGDLKAKIKDDLKAAMLAKDDVRRSTLRSVLAAINNAETEKGRKAPLEDADVERLITREAKRRREAIEQYEKGGREDLAEREQAELAVLEGYLPKQMTREEIVEAVKPVIEELDVSGPRDMGKVMGAVMPKLQGRADGKMVNAVVRELLAES